MTYVLRWNGATMPNGAALFEEDIRGGASVRGFANAIGGAAPKRAVPDQRRVRVRWTLGGATPAEVRDLVDSLQVLVQEGGYLQQVSATIARELYCVPDQVSIDYPETVMSVATVEYTFIAGEPRWRGLTTTSQYVQRPLRWPVASARVDIPGSADAEARLYWWPTYRAFEDLAELTITNRYANLLYNADFAIHTPLSTQWGLATPWTSTVYADSHYQPYILQAKQVQRVNIRGSGPGGNYRTHCRIPYSTVNNQTLSATQTIVWSADVRLTGLTGDWRFYLRLRAFSGTAFGASPVATATSAVIGNIAPIDQTVTTSSWNGRLTATLVAGGGLPASVRWLQPEFTFVSATGGTKTGGGQVRIAEPFVRTDGVHAYEYRPHRTLHWNVASLPNRPALELDLENRRGTFFFETGFGANANAYLSATSSYFTLAPGANELHVHARFTNTQPVTGAVTVYPISTECGTYLEYTPRWWA